MVACWDQNPEKRPTFTEIAQQIRQLALKHPLVNYQSHESTEAPSGYVHFVHTEVLGGNILWNQMPDDMLKALSMFNVYVSIHLVQY